MIVWVRLYFKPSGLRCKMTLTPLKWVLGRDIEKPSLSNQYLHLFHARKYYACHVVKGRGKMAKRSSSE